LREILYELRESFYGLGESLYHSRRDLVGSGGWEDLTWVRENLIESRVIIAELRASLNGGAWEGVAEVGDRFLSCYLESILIIAASNEIWPLEHDYEIQH
jgi:hypothetical protein